MQTRDALLEAARRAGCRLDRADARRVGAAGSQLVGRFSCPDIREGDPWATARLLLALAKDDPSAPRVQELAATLARAGPETGRAIQAYTRRAVRFRRERVETFASPSVTDALGFGDCDDSERLAYALARALGYPARLVFFLKGGSPTHVTLQIQDPHELASWTWVEVTLAARYGEHPLVASARLGNRRTDIGGKAFAMSDDLIPKPIDEDDAPSPIPVPLEGKAEPEPATLGGLSPGQETSPVATPTTTPEMFAALRSAWTFVIGGFASTPSLLVLLAQWHLETGGGRSMFNFNVGGIKHVSGDGHAYAVYGTTEETSGTLTSQHAPFRAYESLEDGARDYLHTIATRFRHAWPAVILGDPAQFSHLLKEEGYYTLHEHDLPGETGYTTRLVARYDQVAREVGAAGGGNVGLVGLLAMIAAGGALAYRMSTS